MSKKADWIDPTISAEDELLGKRQHHKTSDEKDKFVKEEKHYWQIRTFGLVFLILKLGSDEIQRVSINTPECA